MPGKMLNDFDYQKLKLVLLEQSKKGGIGRQEVLEYMNVIEFDSIIELIYTYATLEEIQEFKIIDESNGKTFEFQIDKWLNIYQGQKSEEKLENGYIIEKKEEMSNSSTDVNSFQDVMKYDENYAFVKALEKSLPLGLVDIDNLPEPFAVKKHQNVIFDLSILDYPIEVLFKILASIPNPKILVSESFQDQIENVNSVDSKFSNEQKRYARDILKFLAEDIEEKYSKMEPIILQKKFDLVEYARRKNAIIISNDSRTIALARVQQVKVKILDNKEKDSPFSSNSEFICGVDASIISCNVCELKEKFSQYKSILLSDVTVRELEKVIDGNFSEQEKESANFILQCAAFWGDLKKSISRLNSADKSIVRFYSENPVSIVLTGDFGFGARARRWNVRYEILLQKNTKTSKLSTFLASPVAELSKLIEMNNFSFKFGIALNCCNDDYIKIDVFRFLLKKIIVNVFSPNGQLKEFENNIVKIYQNDIVVLKTANEIAIIILTNVKAAIGKVWYCGDFENIPKQYQKYNLV